MSKIFIPLCLVLLISCARDMKGPRTITEFGAGWKFHLGDIPNAQLTVFQDTGWRTLSIPHDWSIEGAFDKNNPSGVGGGALPGGVGWYRKSFSYSKGQHQKTFVEFDGVYRNSEVWMNGHFLGKRPNGYISFYYDVTPYLHDGPGNVLAVRVDNSEQPNSRWYSGSGIYRNVRLVTTGDVFADTHRIAVITSEVSDASAKVTVTTLVRNTEANDLKIRLTTTLINENKTEVGKATTQVTIPHDSSYYFVQEMLVSSPARWSIEAPHRYAALSHISVNGIGTDESQTFFGIRDFMFDKQNGFVLNGKRVKIKGVCLHHDLGCLGTAVNARALERQLEIMKAMGVNGIRTTHNPPAPELLDLCDKMGFVVMDEAFDIWKKEKNKFDYHLDWDRWHARDLEDQVLRDRNHPSVFIWSIGNEVGEQYNHADSAGAVIARELASIVRKLDPTRPITAACNDISKDNPLIRSGALDLVGYNYHHQDYSAFQKEHPGQKFIGTETTSALETRGHYDMPSDSIRRWPLSWDKPFTEGNADNTVSAYDNVSAPWGSTHEETWKVIKQYDFLSGMFIWTGFDYIGEPTPYGWPSRSSYFGVVDLAGFPKDSYYMYQSEWTDKPVLHIFPHWNWTAGQTIDVWAYYNQADEVELFVNGKSAGSRTKKGDDLHVMWRLKFEPGTLRAVSRKSGKEILVREIKTAGAPAKIILTADRRKINGDGNDLSFITAKIVDVDGNIIPEATHLIKFDVKGEGALIGVDNGDPVSHESFKGVQHQAFHGLCLAVVRAKNVPGRIAIRATAEGLQGSLISIVVD